MHAGGAARGGSPSPFQQRPGGYPGSCQGFGRPPPPQQQQPQQQPQGYGGIGNGFGQQQPPQQQQQAYGGSGNGFAPPQQLPQQGYGGLQPAYGGGAGGGSGGLWQQPPSYAPPPPSGHAPGQCGQPEPSGAPGLNNSGFGSGAPPSYQPGGPQYGGYPPHRQAPPPGSYGQQPQGGYGASQQPQSGYGPPPPSGMWPSTGFGGASSENVEAMSGAQLRAFIQARSPRADTEDMERADLVAIAQALA